MRYRCPQCDRSFSSAAGMKRHRTTIHVNGVEKADPTREPTKPIEEFDDVPVQSRLEGYKLDVERLADGLGHALDNWTEHRNNWASTKCRLCGMEAAAAQTPSAGTPFVSGRATTERCVPRA